MKNRPAISVPDHELLILGTGFSGLGMAIRLREAGFTDFAVVEKEPDVGGTWFVNTYPGCACDVQSHMYSYSFEPNPNWSREFAAQPEILAYLRGCADKYQLRSKIQFNTQMIGAEYDELHNLWSVRLVDSGALEAFLRLRGLKPGDPLPKEDPALPPVRVVTTRVLLPAIGGLSTPAYPSLPGLERFQGKTFHSQRWDHDYDLTDKRVAVIGTGASAIQFVPQIQPKVQKLDLYQRTPPWIMPKPDRAISSVERWAYRNLPGVRLAKRGWLYSALESRAVAFALAPWMFKVVEPVVKAYLRLAVPDAALRKKVTPNYAIGCKRILLSNDWYPALRQPNLELIDAGIREVREHAIVDAHGVERPVDAIIFGTGFRVSDLLPRGMFFGRKGVDLIDLWAQGPEAYKGSAIPGFPNLFFLFGPNTGLGHNSVIYMIESQIHYVLEALRYMRAHRLRELEVSSEAFESFNRDLQARSQETVWTVGGCASWYLDPVSGRNVAIWPDFTFRFRAVTRRFDAEHYKSLAQQNAAAE